MPRFTTTLSLIKLDLKAAEAALHREIIEILKAGVKAWVERATSVIPNWSGASREVFREIGDAVGASFNSGPVNRPWHVPDRRGLGRASSDYRLNLSGPIYEFEHTNNLPHLQINEQFDATQWGFKLLQPGPYNYREQAKRAYQNEVDARLRQRKFNVARYIKHSTKRV